MAVLPSSLALTSIADSSLAVAADLRNNFTSGQTATNALISALGGGTVNQFLQAVDSTHVQWAGAYTAYTPTWTSSGVAPAIGNGTLAGRYLQVGKLVHFSFQFTPGTTTTFGTGTYSFGLPVTGAAALNVPIGSVLANDNSAAVFNNALAIYNSSTSFNVQYPATWPTGVQAVYGAALPWTWANLDFLFMSGAYEAA